MKQLELKKGAYLTEPSLPNIMNDKLRTELKDYVGKLMPLLYKKFGFKAPNFAEEEEYGICTGDLLKPVYIRQPFEQTYLPDDEEPCYKRVEIAEVMYTVGGDVVVANEDGDEWTSADLTTDELVQIADNLERTLNKDRD